MNMFMFTCNGVFSNHKLVIRTYQEVIVEWNPSSGDVLVLCSFKEWIFTAFQLHWNVIDFEDFVYEVNMKLIDIC